MTDIDEMRSQVMKQLQYLFDFDSASFYLASQVRENELERPAGIGYELKDMEAYIHEFKNLDYSEGLMFTGKI